jgi:hypothetical protein
MYKRNVVLSMAIGLLTIGCADQDITGNDVGSATFTPAPPPPGLQTIGFEGDQLTLWPFTGTDLAGTASDPINIVFSGKADPRSLRAALFTLNGNREAYGLPNVFPFNCTWSDAYGDVQTAYADANGWTASVIQLQCGSYDPLRFHLRLFPQGENTLANAHFEMLIPGTADHQVLSWQAAKQLVIVDFMRAGLLAEGPTMYPGMHPQQYRTIPAAIYNNLPVQLKQIAGGPATAPANGVPILSDGMLTRLTLARAVPYVAEPRVEMLTLQYNQVIPRPFCATGPADFVHVKGQVTLDGRVTQLPSGVLTSKLEARGQLVVTPVNPQTGERGESATATIIDKHELLFGDQQLSAHSDILRNENRTNGSGTSLQVRLMVGPTNQYSRTERCN